MSSRAQTFLTVAGVAALGVVAYAVYFDYKRRNDTQFRKSLRKEKKKVDKTIASSRAAAEAALPAIDTAVLRQALEAVKAESAPVNPEEREGYFMSQVSMGEQLALQGPGFEVPAAMAFYRALRVYPSPVELMVIYQKTVPENIFKMVIEMTNLDVRLKIEGYHDHFPPKGYNVSIQNRPGVNGSKQILVAVNDFKAGDVIYKEKPVVSALDTDLQAAGTHCTHCFRVLDDDATPVKAEGDHLGSVYCSKACHDLSLDTSDRLLFTLANPLPAEIPAETVTPQGLEERRKAQVLFTDYVRKEGKTQPILTARFIGRQVALELAKMSDMIPGTVKKPKVKPEYADAESGEYTLADHLERLRYIEVAPTTEERTLLTSVLSSALPGLEQFLTDESHPMMAGKMAYNAFGVTFGEGRDKPVSEKRPEDLERTRTAQGTSRQVGSALYLISSYLPHSCNPNTRPTFTNGTTELHLVATRDIKAGEELYAAYVNVDQLEDETPEESRRRRRAELARGWKFACTCDKCKAEAEEGGIEVSAKDESKLPASLLRFEKDHEGGKPLEPLDP